jgi:hypothetical protein
VVFCPPHDQNPSYGPGAGGGKNGMEKGALVRGRKGIGKKALRKKTHLQVKRHDDFIFGI